MPTIRRRSGPTYTRSDGTIIDPRALVHTCDVCCAENAAFGEMRDGKLMSWCGWDKAKMEPICLNGTSPALSPNNPPFNTTGQR